MRAGLISVLQEHWGQEGIEGLLANEIQGTKGVEGQVNLRKSQPEVEGPRSEMVAGR